MTAITLHGPARSRVLIGLSAALLVNGLLLLLLLLRHQDAQTPGPRRGF